MFNYIKNLFTKKKDKEPFYHPYPINELNTLREYENKQNEKEMKEKIIKDPSDDIRKAGW